MRKASILVFAAGFCFGAANVINSYPGREVVDVVTFWLKETAFALLLAWVVCWFLSVVLRITKH